MFLTTMACLGTLAAHAQTESWDVYTKTLSRGKASYMIDMGLAAEAPVKGIGYLVITGVKTQTCTDEGLPDSQEFQGLYKVSDAVIPAIGMKTTFRYAGTCTYQCERLDYFYVRDTTGIRTALEKVYRDQFRDYTSQIQIKADAAWDTYFKFLYPDAMTVEYIRNRKMVQELKVKGIDPDVEHTIQYSFMFTADTGIDAFMTEAAKLGLKLYQRPSRIKNGKLVQYPLLLTGPSKTGLGDISQITLQLSDLCAKYNGTLQGWELAK